MKKTRQRVWIGVAVALLLAVGGTLGCIVGDAAGAEVINHIVLRVNDRIATLQDYRKLRVEYLQEMSRTELDGADRERLVAELGQRVFRDLFEELLLMSRADQLQIEIPESQVGDALDEMRESAGLENREAFAQALIQSGIDPLEFHERMRDRLRMQEVIGQEVQQAIDVTEEQARRFYRDDPDRFRIPARVRLEEVIVLDESGLSAGERVRLAEEIRRRVEAGEALAEVVAEHAESGRTSGVIDLGWVIQGELDAALEKAVWDLAAGTFSEPVEARGGTHLLHLLERQEEGMQPFQEVSRQIRSFLRQQQFAERYQEYLEELERNAFVRLDPPPEARGFRTITGTLAEELETPELGERAAEAALEEKLEPTADDAGEDLGPAAGAEPRPSAPDPREILEADPGPEPSDPPRPPS